MGALMVVGEAWVLLQGNVWSAGHVGQMSCAWMLCALLGPTRTRGLLGVVTVPLAFLGDQAMKETSDILCDSVCFTGRLDSIGFVYSGGWVRASL